MPTQSVCAALRPPAFFFLFLCVLFAAIGSLPARAQSPAMDPCSGGIRYYLALPDTITNTWDARFPAQILKKNTTAFILHIYSPVDQEIIVGRGKGAEEKVQLTGGRIYRYDAEDIGVPLITEINRPATTVLEISAQYPVIVYVYQMTAFGCAAYTALPVEAWGTEYYAAAWPGQIVRDMFPNGERAFRAIPKEAPAEILVIAAHDGTEVTISPTADLAGCADCRTNPPVVRLNSGEAYLVQSAVDTSLQGLEGQGDPAGTFIRSNKPVGVISGNTRLMHDAGKHPTLAGNSPKDMAMEWLPPTEQHGTEFVFTPTWDDRSFQPGRDVAELRTAEHVCLFSTQGNDNTAARVKEGVDSILNFGVAFGAGKIAGERIDVQRSVNEARAYRTSRPAFGVASPGSMIVLQTITTGNDETRFRSWSTYMTELVPREQWTSFAPVIVPGVPETMQHYINVVADSADRFDIYYRQGNSPAQLFPFNRGAVPGTDLVWGSIPLNKGADYFIEGEKGARFTGHVYGSYGGREEYYPKEEGTGGVGEYHEDVALMYGYPLAPSRCLLSAPDTYEVETDEDCNGMTVNVRATNADPVGLRSITLLPDSGVNTRLVFLSPADPSRLTLDRLSEAEVRILPVDPKKNAQGVVAVQDRTRGGVHYIPYRYEAERVDVDSAKGITLGRIQTGLETERTITLSNPLERDIVVRRLALLRGDQEFRILGTEPAFDWSGGTDSLVLKSGETIRIRIGFAPASDAPAYNDSLLAQFGCTELRLPLRASSTSPCLSVSDLDFGTVVRNKSKEIALELCNNGGFPVAFYDSTASGGGDLLSTGSGAFTVADNYRNLLRRTTLDSGECITIRVRFLGTDTGDYRAVARFWINGRECRDTSIWTAHVTATTMGVAEEERNDGNALAEIAPNPTGGETRIPFRLARGGETQVEVHDGEGRIVALLLNEHLEAGEHTVVWDGRGQAAGIYHIRVRSGAWSAAKQVILVR